MSIQSDIADIVKEAISRIKDRVTSVNGLHDTSYSNQEGSYLDLVIAKAISEEATNNFDSRLKQAVKDGLMPDTKKTKAENDQVLFNGSLCSIELNVGTARSTFDKAKLKTVLALAGMSAAKVAEVEKKCTKESARPQSIKYNLK